MPFEHISVSFPGFGPSTFSTAAGPTGSPIFGMNWDHLAPPAPPPVSLLPARPVQIRYSDTSCSRCGADITQESGIFSPIQDDYLTDQRTGEEIPVEYTHEIVCELCADLVPRRVA